MLPLFLDGSYCTCCEVSQEDAHKPEVVENGFDHTWDIKKLNEHYDQLKKHPDGTIKTTHKGTYLVFYDFEGGIPDLILD